MFKLLRKSSEPARRPSNIRSRRFPSKRTCAANRTRGGTLHRLRRLPSPVRPMRSAWRPTSRRRPAVVDRLRALRLLCGRCEEVCPTDAIRLSTSSNWPSPGVGILTHQGGLPARAVRGLRLTPFAVARGGRLCPGPDRGDRPGAGDAAQRRRLVATCPSCKRLHDVLDQLEARRRPPDRDPSMSRLPSDTQFAPAAGIGKIDTPADVQRMKSSASEGHPAFGLRLPGRLRRLQRHRSRSSPPSRRCSTPNVSASRWSPRRATPTSCSSTPAR